MAKTNAVKKKAEPSKLIKEQQLPEACEGIDKLIIVNKDKSIKEVINK